MAGGTGVGAGKGAERSIGIGSARREGARSTPVAAWPSCLRFPAFRAFVFAVFGTFRARIVATFLLDEWTLDIADFYLTYRAAGGLAPRYSCVR